PDKRGSLRTGLAILRPRIRRDIRTPRRRRHRGSTGVQVCRLFGPEQLAAPDAVAGIGDGVEPSDWNRAAAVFALPERAVVNAPERRGDFRQDVFLILQ